MTSPSVLPANEREPTPSARAPVSLPGTGSTAWPVVFLLLLVWALLFQGSRGIYEPDEGFYGNAALNMLEHSDWLVPRLDNGPFLDKPPFSLWSTAAGMRLLGVNEWGARLGHALWFALAALLVGRIAGRLLGPQAKWPAACAYALMPLPFVGANVITPDTPLACWSALAVDSYLASRAELGRWRYPLLCGLAVGLGILTKGPAMLMLAAPLAIDRLFDFRRRPWLPDVAAAVLAAVVGLSWYVLVARKLPGAAEYFLDNQVTGRLVKADYGRNPGVLGALIYLPVLFVGGLPFSLTWFRRLRDAWRERVWRGLARRPAERFVALWFGLPCGVLLLAQSRLPLYALPLCAPLAVLAVWPEREPGRFLARPWSRRALAGLCGWALLLIAVKGVGAVAPASQDSRAAAAALAAIEPDHGTPVVVVETKRNGLALYGWSDLRQAVLVRNAYKFFTLAPRLVDLLPTIDAPRIVVVTSPSNRPPAETVLRNAGWSCRPSAAPGKTAFLLCDAPASDARR